MRKYYFINKFDTNNIDKQQKKTIIIFRDYTSKKVDEVLIRKIRNYCKKKSLKFYLSNNVKVAIKLNLDGAYIPSFNKELNHLSYSFKKKFNIIGSAHTLKEIKVKDLGSNISKIIENNNFSLGSTIVQAFFLCPRS